MCIYVYTHQSLLSCPCHLVAKHLRDLVANSCLKFWQGHPLVGDPVYGGITPSWCERPGGLTFYRNLLIAWHECFPGIGYMSWPYSLHRVLVGERKGWCFRLGFPLLKLSHSNSGKKPSVVLVIFSIFWRTILKVEMNVLKKKGTSCMIWTWAYWNAKEHGEIWSVISEEKGWQSENKKSALLMLCCASVVALRVSFDFSDFVGRMRVESTVFCLGSFTSDFATLKWSILFVVFEAWKLGLQMTSAPVTVEVGCFSAWWTVNLVQGSWKPAKAKTAIRKPPQNGS